MNLKQHRNAELEGYGKPSFLSIVGRLNELLSINAVFVNKNEVEEVAEDIPAFIGAEDISTSDGYNWFMGLRFQSGDDAMVIAIPCAHWQRKQGCSQLDRSIALYCNTGAGSNLDAVATQFTKRYEEHLRALAERLTKLFEKDLGW